MVSIFFSEEISPLKKALFKDNSSLKNFFIEEMTINK